MNQFLLRISQRWRSPLGMSVAASGALGVTLFVGLHISDSGREKRALSVQVRAASPRSGSLSPRGVSGDQSAEGRLNSIRDRLAHAQRIKDPVEQKEALLGCLSGLTPELAGAVLKKMDRNELMGLAARYLFDFWVMSRPAEAAAWVQNLSQAEAKQTLMNLVALRWGASDLEAAVEWVHLLPAGDLRNKLIQVIGSEAVRSHPVKALHLAAELPVGSDQADLICRAAGVWAATSPEKALAWTQQIGDDILRDRAIREIALVHAIQDPAGAVSILLERTEQSPEQDRGIISIVQTWAAKEPRRVSTWVEQFPNDRLGKEAIDNMVQIWAAQDASAPGSWLSTLPVGERRNAGILAYARELRRTDEQLADQWAALVTPVSADLGAP